MSSIHCVFKWRHKPRALSRKREVRHRKENLPTRESSILYKGLSKKPNSIERQSQQRIVQTGEGREKKPLLFESFDTQEETTTTTAITATLRHFAQSIHTNYVVMHDSCDCYF